MLCQNCKKKEANTHIVRTIGNSRVEMYLCPECARECGFTGDFSISDFLFGDMLASPFLTSQETVCPVCHTSFSQISESGNVGCGECYHTFAQKLHPMISRLHSLPFHKGKVPDKKLSENKVSAEKENVNKEEKEKKPLSVAEQIEELKSKQDEAIKAENFEEAAKLRDKIRELEGGQNNG